MPRTSIVSGVRWCITRILPGIQTHVVGEVLEESFDRLEVGKEKEGVTMCTPRSADGCL